MFRSRLTDNSDVNDLVKYISKIPVANELKPEEFGYPNPVHNCLDAVLSINRRYNEFVLPRIKHFQTHYPQIKTLKQLRSLIQEKGYEGFNRVWQYNHLDRVKMLDDLAKKFISYAEEIHESDDLAAMKNWANKVSPKDYDKFGVHGIGLATFQYLRMLSGVSTVKPDVHIKKAVGYALGRQVSDMEAIWLVEQASKEMGLPATTVDHNLWQYYSSKNK
jgi:hypothetical protein